MFPIPFRLPWAKQHLSSHLTVLQGSAQGAERRHPLNLWLLQLFNHFFGFSPNPFQVLEIVVVDDPLASVGTKRNMLGKSLRTHSYSVMEHHHSLLFFHGSLFSPLCDSSLLRLTDPLARPLFKSLPAVNCGYQQAPQGNKRGSFCSPSTILCLWCLALLIWDTLLFSRLLLKARQLKLECAREVVRWSMQHVQAMYGAAPLSHAS